MRLQVHHKSLTLGEVLDGDRMAESLYHIPFRENVERKTLCQLTLTEKQVLVYGWLQWVDPTLQLSWFVWGFF